MKQLLKTFEHTDKYQVGCEFVTLTSKANVYKQLHTFLWFNWVTYDIQTFIPYIKDPFYDGEYSTNRQLSCIEKMLYGKADTFKHSIND